MGLSGQSSGQTDYGEDSDPYADYQRQQYLQRLMGRSGFAARAEQQNQAVGTDPGSLVFAFYVNASFQLAK